MADVLKAQGNKAFTEKNWEEAMYAASNLSLASVSLTSNSEKFSQAIELQPTNHILYSNRSAAYTSKKDFQKALEDANKTTELKPDWSKGWGRKGAALHGLNELSKSSSYHHT